LKLQFERAAIRMNVAFFKKKTRRTPNYGMRRAGLGFEARGRRKRL
jgi:hypothetical protein